MKKILVMILLATMAHANAMAQPKLIKHSTFGAIPANEAHLFRQLAPYEKRVLYIAQALGVESLGIDFASFKQCSPEHSHEVAHALFNQYFYKRYHVKNKSLLSRHLLNGQLLGGELFADMVRH